MYRYAWERTQMEGIETIFRGFEVPEWDESEMSEPKPVKLDQCPTGFIHDVLGNDAAHPLITMAHLDRLGFPFISVMGFSFLDGKICVASRRNGIKQKRLATDPRCCFTYHNLIPRPDRIAFLTLVGNAVVRDEPELAERHAVAIQNKNYRAGDADEERREPGIAAMIAARREVIVLDEVIGVYLMTPAPRGFASGRPHTSISWRADWKK